MANIIQINGKNVKDITAARMASLAPVEASTTATATHAVGALFWLDGTLYEATAAIAVGGTITVGTNCKVADMNNMPQPDWNQSDSSANDFIKNKPAIRQQANGGILENAATSASGQNSHAEGGGTTASGAYSHAEGGGTTASGQNSHAEGGGTTASGQGSHAEGSGAEAIGTGAHAEGSGTTASTSSSHAEGESTTASGGGAHSEGGGTTASGNASHAEGGGTVASGAYSHAEGTYTTANHMAQHVFGMHNVPDSSTESSGARGNYIEIVGNGFDTNRRSNARTLDWEGNEEVAGDVIAYGCGGANPISLADLKSQITDKQDAPAVAGTSGQVLGLDSSLNPVWVNQQGGGGGVVVDPTLTISGDAADAKVTGDFIRDLETDVDILIKNSIDSPDVLQKIVAAGHIANYLDIGDVITIPWTDNSGNSPVTYQYPFVVVNIADVYDDNDVKHEDALWLMAMYATPKEIVFDAAESTHVDLTQEPNALEGWYYWGVDSSTYTKLHLGTGDPIPTTYPSVVKCGINDVSVLRYGYNRWRYSAYRQWLNSNVGKSVGWWTEQHMGDRPPSTSQNNLPGWLNGFTEDWRAVFKPVKVDTACNTVTDGGVTDTTYDTFFLPSVEQMYGVPEAPGVEGEYWPYWKEETGLDAPTNGSSSNPNDARKIPSIADPTGSAVTCRLRSALRGSSNSVWVLAAAGYLGDVNVTNSYRVLPACVIY